MQRAFLNYCHLPDRMRATLLYISSPAFARLPSESESEWATAFGFQGVNSALAGLVLDPGLALCTVVLVPWGEEYAVEYRGTSIAGTHVASARRPIIMFGSEKVGSAAGLISRFSFGGSVVIQQSCRDVMSLLLKLRRQWISGDEPYEASSKGSWPHALAYSSSMFCISCGRH